MVKVRVLVDGFCIGITRYEKGTQAGEPDKLPEYESGPGNGKTRRFR